MKLDKWVLWKTLIPCFLVVAINLLNVQYVAALRVSDYFTLSYQISLSTAEVNEGQTFNAVASASGTLKAALPISVSAAIIEGCVVATNQVTGMKVTLNADYTVDIAQFPNTIGETLQLTQTVPLTFPLGSPAGSYIITGELIAAKVKGIIWWDITSYLPSSEAVGKVNYVLNSANSTGNSSSGAAGTSTTTPVVIPRLASFKANSLVVNPTTVKHGATVNISIQITNTGDVTGINTVVLKINNQTADTKDVMLAGGESKIVTFTTSRNSSGNYQVEVAGLNGNFIVSKNFIPPWFWPGVTGLIILGLILGLGIGLWRHNKG
jgi:hypothetical protein